MKTKHRQRALVDAVANGEEALVRTMLNSGLDVNTRDTEHQETLLMVALNTQHLSIARLLLEYKANPNLRSEQGKTALMIAAFSAQLSAIELLIQAGADMFMEDGEKQTALCWAVYSGDPSAVACILSYYPESTAPSDREQAFEIAQEYGFKQIQEQLRPDRFPQRDGD